MALIRFTQNIQRHVECPPARIEAGSISEALDSYFQTHPRARGYVLDEHGGLRHHMAVFRNGVQVRDRATLADPLGPDDIIDVMQALSGG